MGMSLELVQNKFASIIEDLSTSPRTLSQFVVWVDLCVAEYKTKGSICLNCSGQKPDPIWLSGLKDRIVDRDKGQVTSQLRSSDTDDHARQATNEDTGSDLGHSRSSGEDNERCPVTDTDHGYVRGSHGSRTHRDTGNYTSGSIHSEPANTSSGSRPHTRQTTSVETRSSGSCTVLEVDSGTCTPRRPGNRESRDYATGGESGDGHVSTETLSASENRNNMVFPVGWIKVSPQRTGSREKADVAEDSSSRSRREKDTGRERTLVTGRALEGASPVGVASGGGTGGVTGRVGNCHKQQDTSVCTLSPSLAVCPTAVKIESESCSNDADYYNDNSSRNNDSSTDATVPSGYVVLQIDGSTELSPPGRIGPYADFRSSPDRKRSAPYVPGPVKKARTTVGNMHRWLREDRHELRRIEAIPPEELDPYLSEFLRMVRRKDGRNYDPNSFKDVRGSIGRYLRDHGYPYSIVRSPLFYPSQCAYFNKKEELRRAMFLAKRGTQQHVLIL